MKSENDKKSIVISVAVAVLLVISVLTAATVTIRAGEPEGESTIEEEETEIAQDLFEDLGREQGVDRPDVLDPELTEILSGGDVSEGESTSSEGLLTDPHTIDQHNVEEVHDMDITGEGVTVSLMDTGFDMAHPDLIGTHAVFEYDEDTMDEEYQAYDGHPIAFDPVSMADYAFDGEISQDYEDTWGGIDNSWYVDTSYETETYEEEGYIWADYGEETYNVTEVAEEDETVRFGDHPDEKLHEWYEERPAVLLTQNEDDEWANVYVDLLNDREIVEESGAWIDGDDPESEAITRDLNDDGIADVSGGMMYFASDGDTPIPYSQNFRYTMNDIINLFMGYPPGTIGEMTDYEDAWHAMTGQDEIHTTPGDGDMVALMGDFNSFGSMGAHGTWTASAVSGQGVTGVPDDMVEGESPYPPTPEGGDGLPRGLSPDAEIIPMGRFFDALPAGNPLGEVPTTYSSTFFTTEGYTGDVAITSDTADIASSSFGRTIDENHGGFNFYERLFDYVGTQYTQSTLFINSQGNSGSGFGTVSAPSGAQGVMSVGASTNMNYRVDEWRMDDGGPNPSYGEVTGMTSTGPHSKGSHGPDIMTNGQFGYGGDPVNQQLANIEDFEGATSWTLWSGTSLSAPNAAGIAALVFQAYEEAHGEAPDSEMLKNMVMQGADDMNNSPNLQGPGEANALNSVEIAQGEGLYSEEFQWRPGTNPEMGEHVEHHVNMMEAGESWSEDLSLHNWNEEDTIEYEMNAYKQEKVGETQVDLSSGMSGPDGDGRVPLVMIDETGVYELIYNETNDNWDLSEEPIAEIDDPEADLFRFGTHTPIENHDWWDYSITEFYNWEDVNDNGSFDGWEERNRIGYTFASLAAVGIEQTSDYFTIYDAMEKAEDGVVVQMQNIYHDFMEEELEFTLNIEQYNQEEWDWIDITDPGDNELGPGETVDYELEANVPAEAIKGIYSGKLMIEDTTNERTHPVPITITVGEHTDLEDPMHFGAAEGEDEHGIYRNDRLFGSWEGGLTGDWRFYTFNLEEDITEQDVRVGIEFEDEFADLSAFLLGGAERDELEFGEPYDVDPFSVEEWGMQDRYGVNTLETMATSDISPMDSFDFAVEGLDAGTYMIAVQSHELSGHHTYNEFSGVVETTDVRTEEAEITGPENVHLRGEVLNIPEGEEEVHAYFEYREAGQTEFDMATEQQVMEEPGTFEEKVMGLEEDTTYEFRAVIEWNDVQTGEIQQFTPENIPVEFEVDPEDGDTVGGQVMISAEMSEEHHVDNFRYAELSLGGWYEDEEEEIGAGAVHFDIPVYLAEGEHTYELYVEDEEGNYHTVEVTFEVDHSEPLLQITSPEDGLVRITEEPISRIMIEGQTYPDIARLEIDGIGITPRVDDETGEFAYEMAIMGDGLTVFEVVAEDIYGNTQREEVYVLRMNQLAELREDVDDITMEISEIETAIEEIDDEITDIQSELISLEDRISSVETDMAVLEQELSSLESSVELLEGRVSDLEDIDFDALESRVDDLEEQLEELEDLEERVSDLEDIDYDELESRIAELEAELEGIDIEELEGRLDDLEGEIGDLEDEIDELSADIDDQDDDIAMARNLGIVGLILAILAIIIAIVAMQKKKPAEEEEPMYEEEEEMFGEEEEEEMFGEEEEEEMFGEEEADEEEIFEEPEESEEELFEEEEEEEL